MKQPFQGYTRLNGQLIFRPTRPGRRKFAIPVRGIDYLARGDPAVTQQYISHQYH